MKLPKFLYVVRCGTKIKGWCLISQKQADARCKELLHEDEIPTITRYGNMDMTDRRGKLTSCLDCKHLDNPAYEKPCNECTGVKRYDCWTSNEKKEAK